MSVLNRLLRALGLRPPDESLAVSPHILEAITDLADAEQRPPEAVASELFWLAMDRREVQQALLERWDSLTRREQEIAALAAMNFNNAEIAAELSISLSTVKTHVHNVLKKFGARNRVELQNLLAGWDFQAWYRQVGGGPTSGA